MEVDIAEEMLRRHPMNSALDGKLAFARTMSMTAHTSSPAG